MCVFRGKKQKRGGGRGCCAGAARRCQKQRTSEVSLMKTDKKWAILPSRLWMNYGATSRVAFLSILSAAQVLKHIFPLLLSVLSSRCPDRPAHATASGKSVSAAEKRKK